MTAYNISWEGVYDAWKQSGLPRRKLQYSEQFKSFISDGGIPSEDTVRTRFRRIRDRHQDLYFAVPIRNQFATLRFEPINLAHFIHRVKKRSEA